MILVLDTKQNILLKYVPIRFLRVLKIFLHNSIYIDMNYETGRSMTFFISYVKQIIFMKAIRISNFFTFIPPLILIRKESAK